MDTVRLSSPGPLPDFREFRKIANIFACEIDCDFEVDTLEGTMSGKAGDYLCRGIQGEFYPCKREIFEESYRPVFSGPKCMGRDCGEPANPDPYKMRKVIKDGSGTLLYTDEIVEAWLCTHHAMQMKFR